MDRILTVGMLVVESFVAPHFVMFAIAKVVSNACNKLVVVDFDTCVGSDPSRTEDLEVITFASLTRNYFNFNDRHQAENYSIQNTSIISKSVTQ